MSSSQDAETQRDELEVLEAIFGEEVSFSPFSQRTHELEAKACRKLVISLSLPLNPRYPVRVWSKDDLQAQGRTFHALPPIHLRCALPPHYPSTVPPSVHIDAPFLSVHMLEIILLKLQAMFERGNTVIFDWAQYIMTDVWADVILPHSMDLQRKWTSNRTDPDPNRNPDNTEQTLSPGTECESGMEVAESILILDLFDKAYMQSKNPKLWRSIQRRERNADEVYQSIADHCERVDAEELRRGFFSCLCCLEQKPGTECIMLRNCRHVACRDCLGQFWMMRINEGSVGAGQLVCVNSDCRQDADPDEIHNAIDSASWEKYERFTLSQALAAMGDIHYCPRKGCEKPATQDPDEASMARCGYCAFVYCTQCQKAWHAPENCAESEDDAESDESDGEDGDSYETANINENDFEHKYMKKVQTKRTNRLMSTFDLKKCPQCRALVSKNGGCSHMHCICGCDWCWQCGNKYSDDYHGLSNCVMYDDPDDQANHEELVAFLEAMGAGEGDDYTDYVL